ncbi:MAG: hypothetical protein WCK29_04590 [archaeon]
MLLARYEEFSQLLDLITESQTKLSKPLIRVDSQNNLYFYKVSKGNEEKIQLDPRDSERFQSSNGKRVNYHYQTR